MKSISEIDRLAKVIWDYHRLNQPLAKAEVIVVFGSHDLRVAEYGAKLFLEGWAPLIIFSGRSGRLTSGAWSITEAEKFAEVAINMGVPREKIIIEDKSTNTGENIIFTKKLLEEKRISHSNLILVQKPYMERRVYTAVKKFMPGQEFTVTSPPISYEEYPDKWRPKDEFIGVLVGHLQRIKVYAEKGWQIPQEIPMAVWSAYTELVELGYTKHLVRDP